MPVLKCDQFRKSILGLFAYLLVEYVDNGTFADRQYQSVLRLPSGELTDVGFHLLRFATQIDSLADERALYPRIGEDRADLVGFRARKAGDTVG